MADAKRSSGVVKWFSVQKGFGFITPSDGSEDLFVHQSSIRSDGFRALYEGDEVEFAVDDAGDGRTKAADVSGPDGAPVSSGGGRGGFYGGRGRRGGGYGGYGGSYGRYGDGYGRGGRGGGRGMGTGRGGYGGDGACFNCGRTGHLARDCYYGGGGGGGRSRGGGRGGAAGYSRGGGGGGGSGCYNCGGEGHFARECPNGKN